MFANPRRLLLFLPILILLLVGLLGSAGPTAAQKGGPPVPAAPAASPTVPACGIQGTVVPSPNIGTGENLLNRVAVVGPDDVWAVGSYFDEAARYYRGLIAHWDGTLWTAMPSPSPGYGTSYLRGVTALAPDDVWAVGYYATDSGSNTLIVHWTGTVWRVVPSPNTSSIENILTGIAAVGPDDVWAVGEATAGGVPATLVLHWNGTAWSVVASPNGAPGGSRLLSVAVAGPDDVWAVGHSPLGTYTYQTLVEHWDGAAWTVVPSPNPGASALLVGVAVAGADDIWAVGGTIGGSGSSATLTLHWDGTAWTVVPSPNLSTDPNELYDVAIGAGGEAWAVGYGVASGSEQALALHWDGAAWTLLPAPNIAIGSGNLYGVVVAGPNAVWAVGEGGFGPQLQTLMVTYSDPCGGSPVFSDVPPTDSFYAAISYVAAQGIMGGYPDGTFRPGNLTTRGQLSKILVLGYGLALQTPAAGASFEDVPRTDGFFPYIETLSTRGIARGYRCGGVNPQTGAGLLCVAPQERPYFLPGNPVTRGQFAKQLVLTASQVDGWPLLTPANGHFSDVPPGSTFYSYVETVAAHGVVGGYADGTFRPAANTTRAQSAAVLYRARAGGGAGLTSPDPTR